MLEKELEEKIQEKKDNLLNSMKDMFGNEPNVIKRLEEIIFNCESRLKRRIKAFSLVKIYNKVYNEYYDVLYDMVKIDYQYLGSEGEISREVDGITSNFGIVRPSDEILSRIPQVL